VISARHLIFNVLLVYALATGLLLAPVQAADLVVDVNVVNPMRASVVDQNAVIGQLKAASVRVIRAILTPDDKGVDFAKRIYAQGIKIELQLGIQYLPNAPTRPYQPQEFPNMWGGHPLSFADPERSRVYFQSLIGKLEANYPMVTDTQYVYYVRRDDNHGPDTRVLFRQRITLHWRWR